MAFITKEQVKVKSEALKALNKQYGIKATFSGSNSSTLQLTIAGGKIDFIGNYINFIEYVRPSNQPFCWNEEMKQHLLKDQHTGVNHYYMDDHFNGEALEYLQKAYAIMKDGHWYESDIQTDYFHCSWYNSIKIGSWNKPYKLEV